MQTAGMPVYFAAKALLGWAASWVKSGGEKANYTGCIYGMFHYMKGASSSLPQNC